MGKLKIISNNWVYERDINNDYDFQIALETIKNNKNNIINSKPRASSQSIIKIEPINSPALKMREALLKSGFTQKDFTIETQSSNRKFTENKKDSPKVCSHENTSFDYNNNIFCIDCRKYKWEWNNEVRKPS